MDAPYKALIKQAVSVQSFYSVYFFDTPARKKASDSNGYPLARSMQLPKSELIKRFTKVLDRK